MFAGKLQKCLRSAICNGVVAAGIDTLIFVTSRNKRVIEDHFDANNELGTMLRAKGKDGQADMVCNIIPAGVECIVVRKTEQLGLGYVRSVLLVAIPFSFRWRTMFLLSTNLV